MTLQPIPLCMSRAGLLSESQPAARRNVFMAPDHVEDMLAHASARFALQMQKQDRVSISANAMRDMLEELMTGEVSVIDDTPVMRMPDGYMTREYGEWVAIVPALDGWVDCMQRIAPSLSSEAIANLGRLIGAGEEITPELVMVARMQLEDQIAEMKRLPICAINAAIESTKADWQAEQKQKEETETMNARDNAPTLPAIDGAINAAHGLLLKSSDALSADDVAKALAIKKAEASKQLRELNGLGLLESEPRKGGTMFFRLAVVAPAKVCDLVQTEGESQTESGTTIDWQAPEMQYLAPEDYVMPPADLELLASANRILSDRLEGVAHVLRGCGLPSLTEISDQEDLQMAAAALSGAYQMALADAAAVPDLRNITAELEATVALQRETLVEAAADVSRLSNELATERRVSGSAVSAVASICEHLGCDDHNGHVPVLRAIDDLRAQIASLTADVMRTRGSLNSAINEADRLRAELAVERQACKTLQESASAAGGSLPDTAAGRRGPQGCGMGGCGMTDLKQLAENLRRYNAWRRDEDPSLKMPKMKDLGEWIEEAANTLDCLTEPEPIKCETCEGAGKIDERLGGYHTSNANAQCPDCDGAGYLESIHDFRPGQWWVKELDGIQASQEATPDQKRAVAVVHNLLRHILKLELPGNVLAQRVETPSSHWSADGNPDPHGKTYDCERAGLHMGNMTDDELANGAFLNYDQPLNVAGILAGTCHSPIAWMTAVKDRIRWLSRSLEKVAAERDALAAELKALGPKGPSYMPNWTNHGAAIAGPVFQQIRGIMGTQNFGQDDALRQAVLHALRTFESSPKPGAFRLGDLVKKVSGSAWEGRIVGTYSTALTPEGYAVESASHPGSVQIYPAKALTLVIQEAGIQPTEGQHAQYVDVSGANVNATFRISKQTGADALVGLRGCNRRHGGMRAVEPCGYRMRTTDPGCTGCVERDEDQPAEAGHENG